MRAAVLNEPGAISKRPLRLIEQPDPIPEKGKVLLRVKACGVCRTDLHIVEGELRSLRRDLIPGHQIVGEIVGTDDSLHPAGTRVGVSWMGGIDGACQYCKRGMENLCDHPIFAGYTVNGGYAEFVTVRSDFVFPLPSGLTDLQAAAEIHLAPRVTTFPLEEAN